MFDKKSPEVPRSQNTEEAEDHHPWPDHSHPGDEPADHGAGGVEDEEGHARVGDVVGRHLVPGGHHGAVDVVIEELHQSISHELGGHQAAHVFLHLVDLRRGAARQYWGLSHTGTQTHHLYASPGEVKLEISHQTSPGIRSGLGRYLISDASGQCYHGTFAHIVLVAFQKVHLIKKYFSDNSSPFGCCAQNSPSIEAMLTTLPPPPPEDKSILLNINILRSMLDKILFST